MNSRLTSMHSRMFAEGILEKAIDAGVEQKQVFIRDAISYLAATRAHDERCAPTELSDPTELENQGDAEGQYRPGRRAAQIRSWRAGAAGYRDSLPAGRRKGQARRPAWRRLLDCGARRIQPAKIGKSFADRDRVLPSVMAPPAKNSAAPEASAAHALSDDGADPVARYEAGNSNKSRGPCSRLALPQARRQSSRKTRPGEQASQVGNFCAWVLLALAPWMQARFGP
jgi:hypothetical protein